ncbi:MAG TPA: efflux RND transporter periplasmic adaptor subunit [Acidobacteriaceae bacterium]
MAQQVSVRSRGWVWVLVAFAAGVALFLYVRSGRAVVTVGAARVERHNLASEKSTNGRVTPLEDFQAHAPISGLVNRIFVRLGQTVQSGQELVQMDDSQARKDLAAAQASLASSMASLQAMERGGTQDEILAQSADLSAAKAQVSQDTASLASLQTLETKGAASANEVALAQQHLNAAKQRVLQIQARRHTRYSSDDLKAQKAQVAEARAAVDAAQTVFAGVNIRSPFAGTVYAIPVTQYEFVSAGETLIQVADLTKLQIKAYFDEPEIGLLKTGQPVSIKWEAKPGKEWHGHVVQVPTTIISYGGTRNVGECLISVDDANGDLLPNTNVTVKVTEAQHDQVLSLPREALHTVGMNDFVYKIVENRLVRTPIRVGLTNLTRFEILDGLKEGDLVALGSTNETDLSDGLRVKVKP